MPSSQIAEIKGSASDVRDRGMQIVRLEGNNCGESNRRLSAGNLTSRLLRRPLRTTEFGIASSRYRLHEIPASKKI